MRKMGTDSLREKIKKDVLTSLCGIYKYVVHIILPIYTLIS